jgi:hypothetical protein
MEDRPKVDQEDTAITEKDLGMADALTTGANDKEESSPQLAFHGTPRCKFLPLTVIMGASCLHYNTSSLDE